MATQPDATNPWFGIDANISKNLTTTQQATDYWKTGTIAPPSSSTPVSTSTLSSGSLNYPTGAQPQTGTGLVGASGAAISAPTPVNASSTPSLDQATGSTPPAGATYISGPSGLQGLTESQIWRDPTSNKIYKLAAPGTGGATSPTGTSTGTATAAPGTSTTGTPTPGLGDYSTDPAYQAAQEKQAGLESDLKTAQQGLPSQYDTYKNEMESSGANAAKADMLAQQSKYDALMADYNNTAAAYGLQIAQNEQHAMQNGVPAVFYQGEGGAMQRTQAAILNQKATLIGAQATQMARSQQNFELAEHLASKTADLKFADAQQKIDNIKDFIELNQQNLTRVEKLAISKMEASAKERQRVLDIQKENYREALVMGVKAQYVNRNGKFYRTNDGKEYDSEAAFFKDAGVKTFAEAYKKGLVADINGDMIADRELLSEMRAHYWDAGITLGDTMDQARAKIQSSNIYAKETAPSAMDNLLRILTPTEAGALGVPFGSTAQDAFGLTAQKPLTEAQAKDLTYANRASDSQTVLKSLESIIAGYSPIQFAAEKAAEAYDVTSPLVTDTMRQLRQAERNFGTAILRRESGAAISASEFSTMEKQYFPRPGDDEATLAQKAQARETAIRAFMASAPNQTSAQSADGENWTW